MVDPWIEKAWRMQRERNVSPTSASLKAALSLEKKQNEAPDYDTAAVIAPLSGARTEKKEKGPVSIMFPKL